MLKQLLSKIFFKKYSKFISKINLKPKEFLLSKDDKALCLAPHADDESIGMGGFLSKFHENFDVILLTDGAKGIKDVPGDKVTKIREEEFKKAMNIANIKNYSFLSAPDGKLTDSFDLFKKIDISEYNYIFIPNIIDQHPDHKAVSILLNELLESSTKYKKELKICFYEVWSTLGFVNGFFEITDFVNQKKEMIASYESQTATKDYEYHILGLNGYRGIFKNKKYVEAFMVLDIKDFKDICKIYQ